MEQTNRGFRFTQDEVDAIRFLFDSMAYTDYYVPMIESLIKSWTDQLLDPSLERKGQTSDDYLRGCVATLQAVLNFPTLLLREDEEEKQRAAAAEADRLEDLAPPAPRYGPIPPEPAPAYLGRLE